MSTTAHQQVKEEEGNAHTCKEKMEGQTDLGSTTCKLY